MFNSRGFTLIELITTFSILAIIAAIGIPAFGSVRDRAEYASIAADVRTYRIAAYSAIATFGAPEDTLVWGDDVAEEGVWDENTWVPTGIMEGILITITDGGEVLVSLDEEADTFESYSQLIAEYGGNLMDT